MIKLSEPVVQLLDAFDVQSVRIPPARKESLKELARVISREYKNHQAINILVICTHNSRRSHIGDLVLKMIAPELGFNNLQSYSGGTEITQVNPRLVYALKSLSIPATSDGNGNPHYRFHIYEDGYTDQEFYSKIYHQPPNPQSDFLALMVCDSADEACPVVKGAKHRFSLPFQDPKRYDGTPEESKAYRASIYEIGRELFYTLKKAKQYSATAEDVARSL